MKILLIHQHFNTPSEGGAIRSYYLAKEMIGNGFQVIVITGSNSNAYQTRTIEGIHVHYLPVNYKNEFGFIKRSFSFLKFIATSTKLSKKFRDVDLCYAISTPLTVGLTAIRLKRKYNIPFIFEVGDLWPDAPVELGFIRNQFLKKSLYRLEKKIYNEASHVVALSPAISKAIKEKCPGKETTVISNFSDVSFFNGRNENATFKTRRPFIVSYIGAIGYANGLEYYLQCAKKSQHLPIRFLICGQGAMLDSLKASATQMNLDNMTFLTFRNRDGVKGILDQSDAAFICFRSEKILETGSPNKYFDGLASGKLIISNFEGWLKEEIETNHCGIYVDKNDPADFSRKIVHFIENSDVLREFQQNAFQLAKRKYDRPILGDILVHTILQTLKKTGR